MYIVIFDSKPTDEIPKDNVFSRIDASKLNTAIGNASVLQTMSVSAW